MQISLYHGGPRRQVGNRGLTGRQAGPDNRRCGNLFRKLPSPLGTGTPQPGCVCRLCRQRSPRTAGNRGIGMINFKSPKCGEWMSVPQSLSGKTETCPNCANVAIVLDIDQSQWPSKRPPVTGGGAGNQAGLRSVGYVMQAVAGLLLGSSLSQMLFSDTADSSTVLLMLISGGLIAGAGYTIVDYAKTKKIGRAHV